MDVAAKLSDGSRLLINCHACGLSRMLPEGLGVGDVFYLTPCPKCWTPPLVLRLDDDGVREVTPDEFRQVMGVSADAKIS